MAPRPPDLPARACRASDSRHPHHPLIAAAALLALLCLVLPARAAAVPASALRPVHATSGAGARFEDDLGRTVLLRGVNVNQLGEYAVNAPGFASTYPLTDDDFTRIASLGFDTVRLLVTWSRIEPQRGVFDDAYLATVRHWVDVAAEHGIYTVVDMHQDAWGVAVGTPDGVDCPAPLSPAIGWDGAPAWATITDGLTTCNAGVRELSPAVAEAWTNLYLNRDGIRDELVASWARLAGAVADLPSVVGWDVLNEPNPGLATIGTSELLLLGAYQDAAFDAIRAAETATPGGFAHVAFFEPSVEWSAVGVTGVQLPGFTDAGNLAFAPHLYADSITLDRTLGITLVSIAQGHAAAAAVAALHGVPYWSGEWGWFGNPATDGAKVAEYARQEDAHLVGGAWWSWRQACGDPHQVGGRGNTPGALSPSLIRYGCPGDVELGTPDEFASVLSRSYPRAAPGQLTSLTSDPATGAMTLTGTAPGASNPAAALELWVPDRGLGAPMVGGTGVSNVVVVAVAGGWRVAATATDSYVVTVQPSDAAPPATPAPTPVDVAAATGGTLPATGARSPYLAIGVVALVLALLGVHVSRTGRRWS